jgi:ribosomal protein L32
MGQPKKRTSARRTGTRRSHLILKLARAVNAKSPVKARTTKNDTGRVKKVAKPAAKASVKKPAAKKTAKSA